MDGLAGATSVTSLNAAEGLGALFRGGQIEVKSCNKLNGKEAVVAVARLLSRSETTLTKLELMCVCIHTPALINHPTHLPHTRTPAHTGTGRHN